LTFSEPFWTDDLPYITIGSARLWQVCQKKGIINQQLFSYTCC